MAKDDVLIVLESDKASMEIPAPHAGQILSLKCKKGDEVKSGDPLALMLAIASPAPSPSAAPSPVAPAPVGSTAVSAPPAPSSTTLTQPPAASTGGIFYAGPAVRRLAREFGVDLRQIRGSGVRGRILKEDVQLYVRGALRRGEAGLPAPPTVDFAQFRQDAKHCNDAHAKDNCPEYARRLAQHPPCCPVLKMPILPT